MKRPTLDRAAVQEWLSDQRAMDERIETERVRFLLALTSEQSLRLYLDCLSSQPATEWHRPASPLLMAMRRALAKKERG